MAAIEQVAQQGLACVTHMTLQVSSLYVWYQLYCLYYQGLLILKRCHFEPRYILTMPLTGQVAYFKYLLENFKIFKVT